MTFENTPDVNRRIIVLDKVIVIHDWIRTQLNIQLNDFQLDELEAIIGSEEVMVFRRSGRRAGRSYLLMLLSLYYCFEKNRNIAIISITYNISDSLYREMVALINASHMNKNMAVASIQLNRTVVNLHSNSKIQFFFIQHIESQLCSRSFWAIFVDGNVVDRLSFGPFIDNTLKPCSDRILIYGP